MKDKICVIYDLDEEYARGVARAITATRLLNMEIMIFTREQELFFFIEQNHVYLLIADEEIISAEALECIMSFRETDDDNINIVCNPYAKIEKMIILSEDREKELIGSRYRKIFKYQAVDAICKEIKELCTEKSNMGSSAVEYIGVYSPISCAYKTSFSIALANALGEKSKVLYMNLESFSGLGEVLKQSNGNLSDAIYYYKTGGNIKYQKINELILNEGRFDYIAPVNCFEDISSLSAENWIDFISEIGARGFYDFVVIDISNDVNRAWELADFCKKVYMPVKRDFISLKKINDYEKCCIASGKEKLLDKSEKVVVPYDETVKSGNGFIRQLEFGVLGAFARGISENG